jgi:hypothetical protein
MTRDWEPYRDLQGMSESDKDERFLARKARMEEETRIWKEKETQKRARKLAVEEAILDIAKSQKKILEELAWIREKLISRLNR